MPFARRKIPNVFCDKLIDRLDCFAIQLRALMRVLMLERTYHPLSAPANATGHQCTDSNSSSETGLIAIAHHELRHDRRRQRDLPVRNYCHAD